MVCIFRKLVFWTKIHKNDKGDGITSGNIITAFNQKDPQINEELNEEENV